MKGILIDTSIIIDFLRQKDKQQTILLKLEQNYPQLFASIITHTESYAGKSIWEEKKAMEVLNFVFSSIKILSLDEKTSRKAGEIRARYNRDLADAIIAATAINNKLTLVTLNVRDFEKIKGIRLWQSLKDNPLRQAKASGNLAN